MRVVQANLFNGKYIPDDVLKDRDRRAALAHRPGIVPLGDPLPGYSAADRAPSIAPERQPDPLEALTIKLINVQVRRSKSLGKYG